jgi:hypothetical protein
MEEITKLIDDLQPQAARYDTPIADDLLICTFPNGVRTWIFTYATNGFQRRRSIGVYPEMSLADARQALISARKLQQVEDHLAQHGLASEVIRQEPIDEEAPGAPRALGPRRWIERRTVSAAVAGALTSVAILLGARQLPANIFPVGTRVAATATPVTPAAEAPRAAAQVPARSESVAEPPVAKAPENVASTPVATASATDPTQLSPANRALLKAQESLRGSVARETLARDIEGDRPLRPFETQLTLDADEPTTVYYFTDLRGMAGKTVLHRWLHQGKLVSEVSMQVGEGWLSALHSSVTVAPSMTGRWDVQVCDAAGKALEQETFEIAPTPQLSSR